jgi:branched-chain amino acid transport system permease protein
MGTGNAMRIGINIFLYIAMAEMWNLMAGYAGMISLGQQLFIGVSGYAIAVVCTTYGLPFWVGFLVGGVISAMLAFCLSLLLLKMRGMYFAISTWVFAEMVKIILPGGSSSTTGAACQSNSNRIRQRARSTSCAFPFASFPSCLFIFS